MSLTFGSLFSGIGGIDLGLERAGMTCKWMVEIDDFCQKVLAKRWPEVRRYRDVREVGKHNLEPVDLIAGGFPCQPHSVSGKRGGKDDDRNLWPEYLRIIREIKPTWVVGENVPGIITTMLDDVLSDLEGAGYTPTVFNIPACAFGANHIRYRIIVVAHSVSVGRSEGAGSTIRYEKQEPKGQESKYICESISETAYVANTQKQGLEGADADGRTRADGWDMQQSWGNWWSVEPNVGRVANGVPDRVDRLKSLGNAVVPQVAEYIGRCIALASENSQTVVK